MRNLRKVAGWSILPNNSGGAEPESPGKAIHIEIGDDSDYTAVLFRRIALDQIPSVWLACYYDNKLSVELICDIEYRLSG